MFRARGGLLDIVSLNINWAPFNGSTVGFSVVQPSIALGFTDFPSSEIPQPGSSKTLDALQDRDMFPIVYRFFGSYEAVYGTRTVRSITNPTLATVFFWEVRKAPAASTWTLYHSAHLPNSDGNNRFMPSISVDSSGNTALVYTVVGPSIFPSMRVIGRSASEAPFSPPLLSREQTIATGTSFYDFSSSTMQRWGDYATANLDPSDGCTIFVSHQYTLNQTWATRIAGVRFTVRTFSFFFDFNRVIEG